MNGNVWFNSQSDRPGMIGVLHNEGRDLGNLGIVSECELDSGSVMRTDTRPTNKTLTCMEVWIGEKTLCLTIWLQMGKNEQRTMRAYQCLVQVQAEPNLNV